MTFVRFEDIVAWQKAKELAVDIYKAFEDSRDRSFNDQIQRASVSISNNIAEGYERRSNADFKHFLYISKGSAGEVRSMLHIAKELKKINEEQFNILYGRSLEVTRMLSALIKTL